MTINVTSEVEAALCDQAKKQGVSPEALALDALRERFVGRVVPVEPKDEWERRLFGAARDYGVSLPNWAVSSEGIYD